MCKCWFRRKSRRGDGEEPRAKSWLTLASLLVFAGFSHEAGALPAGEVVDSVVAAYGGVRAVRQLDDFEVRARVSTPMRSGPGLESRKFRAPDYFAVEIAYPDATEVRILDQGRAWQGDEQRRRLVEGPARLSMVYEMLRSTVPLSLVQHRSALQDRGTATLRGEPCLVLLLPWSQDLQLSFWIDLQTKRVLQTEGVLRSEGSPMSFETRFEDFRPVEGLLVPFREENFAAGERIATTEILEVSPRPGFRGSRDEPSDERH